MTGHFADLVSDIAALRDPPDQVGRHVITRGNTLARVVYQPKGLVVALDTDELAHLTHIYSRLPDQVPAPDQDPFDPQEPPEHYQRCPRGNDSINRPHDFHAINPDDTFPTILCRLCGHTFRPIP